MSDAAPLSPAALALLARRAAAASRVKPIPRQEAPLSFPQLTQWFFAQLHPDSTVFNVARILALRGHLDRTALRQSLQSIVERHAALRTIFLPDGEEPVQRIMAPRPVSIDFHDLRSAASIDRSRVSSELLESAAAVPFDLSADQLLRATVVQVADDEWRLHVTSHHIAFDGWSTGIFLTEFGELYRAAVEGNAVPLPLLDAQVPDAAAWQRMQADGAELVGDRAFWQQQLRGVPALELPLDYAPAAIPNHRGAQLECAIPVESWRLLVDFAREHGATPFNVAFAAWGALAARRCDQQRALLGVTLAGRTQLEWEPLIGNFATVMPMAVDVDGTITFAELVTQVRHRSAAGFAHQHFPFQQIAADVAPARRSGIDALFPATFNFRNYPVRLPEGLPGLSVTDVASPLRGTDAALNLNVIPDGDGARLELAFDPEQISAATAQRWIEAYVALLEAALRSPAAPVMRLPIMGAAEAAQLAAWNHTDRPRDRDATLSLLVARQVATTPDRIAVTAIDGEWTFRQLADRSTHIAGALRAHGIGPGSFVAICMDRSAGLVAGILGIVEAGAAYVPIDPRYPGPRIDAMLEEARVTVMITGAGTPDGLAGNGRTLLHWNAPPSDDSRVTPGTPATAADPAYVIFTSGSTGRPKGVVISHFAIANHMEWMRAELPLNAEDRVLQQTSVSFDASVWELFAPLQSGARMVLARPGSNRDPAALIDEIVKHRITEIQVVPSMLRAMLETGRLGTATTLRRVCCGGEAMTWDLIAAFRRTLPAELVNLYGPTEAAIDSTYWIADVDTGPGPVPIGRPIGNARAHVVDRAGQLCPIGTPGELFMAGDGIALGYLNQPELTAERFVSDRFSGSGRMYRTGDRASWRSDGVLEFFGRLDNQVKVRGFRIEPGEIEAVVSALPGVRLAAVVVEAGSANEPRLVAHVELSPPPALDAAAIRAALRCQLPEYMLPARVVVGDRLPRTPSGKIDRAALAASSATDPADEAAATDDWAPDSTLEYTLTILWQRLLGVAKVGLDDDFFELGGHSLLAAKMVNELLLTTGHQLPLAMLFEASTIRSLMPRLLAHSFPGADAGVHVVQQGAPGRIPFFMLTGDMMGGGFYCRGVANALDPAQPVYAVAPVPATSEPGLATIDGMAELHLGDVRRIQPAGPYRLGGFCVGGLVAYEMARRLRAAGEEVDLLLLVDAGAPHPFGRTLNLLTDMAGRLAAGDAHARIDRIAYLKSRVALYAELPLLHRMAMIARYPARLLRRGIDRLTGRRISEPTAEPDDATAGSPYRLALKHHGRAQDLYRHGRYDGRIDLLRSLNARRSAPAELAGWRRVAPKVVMHEAPGAHTEVVFTHLPNLLRQQLGRVDAGRA